MNKSLLTNIFSLLIIAVGYVSPVASNELKTMGLYSFSGAITNWLAIHMLFEKIPFLYGSGIITERFEDFKLRIKDLIMNQFFTQENLNKFLSAGLSSDDSGKSPLDSKTIISAINFDNVFLKLKSAILESPFGGMLGMFGGEQALDPLKPQFESKFEEIVEDMLNDENFIAALSPSSEQGVELLDKVQLIVTERLNELTPLMVKDIIQTMIKEHLGWLVVWGGVFGALIGLFTTFI
jgi:uncharacterized membrane protein YheB (UPF0754 family)